MRKISLKPLTQVKLEVIESNSINTVEDLVKHIEKDSRLNSLIFADGKVKFINRSDKAEYGAILSAVLPAGDIILFVTPTENKQGLSIDYDNITASDVPNLKYNELRSLGSHLNEEEDTDIDLSGSKSEVASRIVSYLMDRDDEEVIEEEDDEEDTNVEEFKQSVDYIIGDINSELDDIDTSVTNINIFINNLKSLMSSFVSSKDIAENVIIPAVTEESLDGEQVSIMEQYQG